MTDPIRNSLTYLRDHTVEEAIQNNHLPLPTGWIAPLQIGFSLLTTWSDVSARITALVTGILARNAIFLQDGDLISLRKAYNHPYSSPDQKDRVFNICLRVGLRDINPELREREAGQIAPREADPTTRACILQAMETIPSRDRTRVAIISIVSLFQGVTDPEIQRSILLEIAIQPGQLQALVATRERIRNERLRGEIPRERWLRQQNEANVELRPSPEEVDGRIFTVSVKPLLDKARIRSMAFRDLPSNVTPDTLRDLFQNLDERLSRLSFERKAQVLTQIENENVTPYRSLRTGMLDDITIASILQKKATEHPSRQVPLEVMQLFAIIQFILSKPNTAQPGQFLTERDDILLKVAAGIQGCSGGKKEGIYGTYNLIKGQFTREHHSGNERIKNYIYRIIDRELTTLLSENTPLMRALTGTPYISQLAHQAMYAKNLIGKKVGLIWDLIQDPYIYIVSPILANKTAAQALEIFFHYFTPSLVIAALKSQIKRDLCDMNSTDPEKRRSATAIYNLLYAELGEQKYWEVDENALEPTYSVTTEGVIKLLTTCDYLKEPQALPIHLSTLQIHLSTLQILDDMKRVAESSPILRTKCGALETKDAPLLHALFGRMYWHHVKTGKKRVEHIDYGRAAFLETDPRIVVTKVERQEVIRQVQIERVLRAMKGSEGNEPLISWLEQADGRNTANRLYGKMYLALQRAGKLRGYDRFGGGEAAFRVAGQLREEKIAAIDDLALELRTEWLPPEARSI